MKRKQLELWDRRIERLCRENRKFAAMCNRAEEVLHNCANRSVNLGRPVYVVPVAHIFRVIRVQMFNRLKAKFDDIEKKQENI